ncbi:LuxR C-terminal-related transcriptional regulator [Variovorax dokdonensis]|uniref:LuxR C-terminal-related transcriptional regulator n=1 Tax=Variovorax dokdonensis TaxID=344883 RepID=A0ABT7N9C7_9BURK|nr:LuxR C-terminal-related transcriptional regulator [Variovorax dokdonensis]
MKSPAPISDTVSDDLLLRVSPPRVPRHLVARARLLASDAAFQGVPAILVQAPAGFGKTSLLAQWRLEHLARGTVVAWVSAQNTDTPQRLAQVLALAVRQGSGRATFGHVLLDAAGPGGLESITIWLAEVVQTALEVVLIVDEAERLPQASRDALAYLLRNAPPNLRVVIAARPDCNLDIDDLMAYGQCVVVGPALLRLRLEETLELVQGRLGSRIDSDAAARLHELTEGWPLGLQLAMTLVGQGTDARAQVASLAAMGGSVRDRVLALLLSNLNAADRDYLARIAILDNLHPDLCRAATEMEDAAERLHRLARDTPVFVASEQGDWVRMHTLARDVLRQSFSALPEQEQSQVHARAARWLGARGLLEDAARHALAAGQNELAYELAERSLYESIVTHGRQGVVLEWLSQLPAKELDRRPRLLLAAAWTLATSERHEDAGRMVARILAQPDVSDALRCECALILSGAAVFADDPDRFVELHQPWADNPPLLDPMLLQVHANRTAYRTLLEGDPALARLRQQQSPAPESGRRQDFVGRWGELIIGLTYVWEGQVRLVENLLQPAVASAEGELGRRNSFTCMLAALLASALWERGRASDAAALLAGRLDVLERSGLPEALLLAYRTLARMAAAEGAEHRAMELLGALDAIGSARNLPRLRIASLVEQVRIHARRYRAQTCAELCVRIEAMLEDPALPRGPMWRRSVDLLHRLAQGHAAIAAQDWRGALLPLNQAAELAQAIRQGRLHLEILGLRAFALDRCGERSLPLLKEAMDLAASYGLVRVFDDAHPDLGQWARQADGEATSSVHAAPPPAPAAPKEPPRLLVGRGMVLTPKEREVLELLARNLSNKEIGRALQVSETTVKWHVKNLLAKLDAGTRKEVVVRARILGLIQSSD